MWMAHICPLLLFLVVPANALAAQNSLVEATRARPPPGALGAPAHLDGLQKGPYELSVSRTDALDGSEVAFGVQKLATTPACFHLRGILSPAECDHLIKKADAQSMQKAVTAGGATRSGCEVAWLKVEQDPVASELSAVVAELLLTEQVRDASGWGRGGGFENLQVLKYSEGGEFKLHHDANEETPRTLTVLLYLNGKGETWFPLATEQQPPPANPRNRQAALAACAGLIPGRDGLLVGPSKGDAVAFYNFVDDGSGSLERRAFHAGMPATEEKSVAALWYHLGEGALSQKPKLTRLSGRKVVPPVVASEDGRSRRPKKAKPASRANKPSGPKKGFG